MEIADKSQRSFDNVYTTVFPLVVRIAFRITGDMSVAEDICQEAFVRYYERSPTIPSLEESKYWLIRVTKNLCFNYEKRRGRERKVFEKILKEPGKAAETGETEVLKKESLAAVQKALDLLPYNLRIVLVLKEYGDLSYKEIGSVLGITEGNVKVRVFRARERLAEILKGGDVYVP